MTPTMIENFILNEFVKAVSFSDLPHTLSIPKA